MPRSILEIDVQDEKFQAFLKLFGEYQDQLGKQSALWEEAGKATETTEKATASLADVVAAIGASAALITAETAKTAEAFERAAPAAERTDHAMKSMVGHAKSIADSIIHATHELAKWAALSLGAGLIGGGVGLFGLDQLAGAVSGQRKAAQGLGMTAGEVAAFNANYGSRLVGSDFLSTIQSIQTDKAQEWKFAALGIHGDPEQMETGDLSIDVIRRARELWQQAGPGGHSKQWMDAHGLDFMGFSTWQRIGQASEKDLAGYETQYRKDAQTMGASDPIQRQWQDFSVQLERAGKQIEAVFVTALKPLLPGLTDLSKDVEKLIAGALGNPHLKEWIDDLGKALSAFGDYLGSDKFGHDVKTLADDIAYAAGRVHDALVYFKLLPDAPPAPDPDETTRDSLRKQGYSVPGGYHYVTHPPVTNYSAADPANPIITGRQSLRDKWTNPSAGLDFTDVENAYGLPPGLMRSLGLQESDLRAAPRDSVVKGKHYQGMFQLGPEVQHDYHVTNPYDPNQSANAAGMEMRDLLKKYQGNVAEALAAHNWGPTHLDADIKANGKDWLRSAPPETQKFVEQIANRMHVQVSVLNQTGAQVAILANGVRQ